ncbi:hypothetical protein I0C86_23245 [Plantactinospora sp. S1510]|uniref:Uncharacterized protein n=1 Tax=Plantactinospora alkalitolerans TaxID=2789879 RepID=A0ABS0H0W7_9ACTN|nr:hypothetical protein [Plantactinospora alkalitolerans]MBF9131858.1 hypothetical protein [Plantactinospora alkalitolerans]
MAGWDGGPSETGMAYDIYAPLWGLLDLGALVSCDFAPPSADSFTRYVTSRRTQVDRLLDLVRALGDFHPETIGIFEKQGGWGNDSRREPEAVLAALLLSAGFLERHPVDPGDTTTIRRLARAAIDRQLVNLLDALVGVAQVRSRDVASACADVLEALAIACSLVERNVPGTVADTVRSWRTFVLPDVLRPGSPTSDATKDRLRDILHRLERLV